jgi:hypothetical protein
MRVETQNFSEYEGIFKCFSAKCEMVLELAHKVRKIKSCRYLEFFKKSLVTVSGTYSTNFLPLKIKYDH